MFHDGIEQQKDVLSFLLIGQSNMAGRGDFGEVEPIRNEKCLMLRMGRWQPMSEPINPDRAVLDPHFHSGVGLSASFADDLANSTGQKIGLIPCADGGTKLSQWMPGEILFDHAVMMTKLALRTSVLGGILWHQGESDADDPALSASYKERFLTMITEMKKQLGAEDVPLVLGELSRDIAPSFGITEGTPVINAAFHEIADILPRCAVASSAGLPLKPDGLHFSSAGQREFGHRYYRAYQSINQ